MKLAYLTTAIDPVDALVLCSLYLLSKIGLINRIATLLQLTILLHWNQFLRSDALSIVVNRQHKTIRLYNPHSQLHVGQN